MNKQEYVFESVTKRIRFFNEKNSAMDPENVVCKHYDEEGQLVDEKPSIGEWVHREPGFTEYDACCQACYDETVKWVSEKFDRLVTGTETDKDRNYHYCERCKKDGKLFTALLEEGKEPQIEKVGFTYIDPEDGSWMDMCKTCYTKQRNRDLQEVEEYERDQRERWMGEED